MAIMFIYYLQKKNTKKKKMNNHDSYDKSLTQEHRVTILQFEEI